MIGGLDNDRNVMCNERHRLVDKELDEMKEDVKEIKLADTKRDIANASLITNIDNLVQRVDTLVSLFTKVSIGVFLGLTGFFLWYVQTI